LPGETSIIAISPENHMGLNVNQLHQGDCVELLGQVAPESIDLIFADPPFNIGYKYDIYEDRREEDDYLSWCRKWIDGIYKALKKDGTFWLAIGDEYAAELKIEAKRAGFTCRSWVIWYYTFGVNCTNGFSRSHTHIFHFIKDPKRFTFNRFNPQIRVKSARQLVYADTRANPIGRLPDNTWITRPQDAPWGFSPSHDTWYFCRVAGTFKEREGFHGCQMPEQLLARIIRASSNPNDTVLDPFGGSGTTLCVAKKLGRQWMGFELSEEYAERIRERMGRTEVGESIDGSEDPVLSAPTTAEGKTRRKPLESQLNDLACEAFMSTSGGGHSTEAILCDPELNQKYIDLCSAKSKEGNTFSWNRRLLDMQQADELPKPKRKLKPITEELFDSLGYACEVAWRLLSLDYHQSLDDILCSPESSKEFERIARLYGNFSTTIQTVDLKRTVWKLRQIAIKHSSISKKDVKDWTKANRKLPSAKLNENLWHLAVPGVYILSSNDGVLLVSESLDMCQQIESILQNEAWQKIQPNEVTFLPTTGDHAERSRVKGILVRRELPLLNTPDWLGTTPLQDRTKHSDGVIE
jgi:site-specific DNA-methyltransferase (adenine-specific)